MRAVLGAEMGARPAGSARRTPVRRAAASAPRQPRHGLAPRLPRAGTPLGFPALVPLPFDLPPVSRGFAALTVRARRQGAEAAAAASRALAEVLGGDVELRGRALPGPPWPRTPAAELAVDLARLPAAATLEVEPDAGGAAPRPARRRRRRGGGLRLRAHPAGAGPRSSSSRLLALDGACAAGGLERGARASLSCARRSRMGAAEPWASSSSSRQGRSAAGPGCSCPPGACAPWRRRSRCRLTAGSGSPSRSAAAQASLLPEELEAPGARGRPPRPGPGRRARGAGPAGRLPGGAGASDPMAFTWRRRACRHAYREIPITLEVELCRVELPLGELAAARPGRRPAARRSIVAGR